MQKQQACLPNRAFLPVASIKWQVLASKPLEMSCRPLVIIISFRPFLHSIFFPPIPPPPLHISFSCFKVTTQIDYNLDGSSTHFEFPGSEFPSRARDPRGGSQLGGHFPIKPTVVPCKFGQRGLAMELTPINPLHEPYSGQDVGYGAELKRAS